MRNSGFLLRSPALWLGLFGLLFLLWAWGDSLRNTSLISYSTTARSISAAHGDSEIAVWSIEPTNDDPGWMHGRWERGANLRFRRPSFQSEPGSSMLKLPDWLLVGLYVGVWGGLLGWRWRKRMRVEG